MALLLLTFFLYIAYPSMELSVASLRMARGTRRYMRTFRLESPDTHELPAAATCRCLAIEQWHLPFPSQLPVFTTERCPVFPPQHDVLPSSRSFIRGRNHLRMHEPRASIGRHEATLTAAPWQASRGNLSADWYSCAKCQTVRDHSTTKPVHITRCASYFAVLSPLTAFNAVYGN